MESLYHYCYKNGNYIVHKRGNLLTKRACRFGEDLVASFPDSIDLKISNKCSWGCPYCHESSFSGGKIMDLGKTMSVLSQLPDLPIEIAIGGGNVLESPKETIELINWLNNRGNLTRITINAKDLQIKTEDKINIFDKVGGIGVSLDGLPSNSSDLIVDEFSGIPSIKKTLFSKIYSSDYWFGSRINIVIHIIAGIFPIDQLEDLFEYADAPVLILGYKQWGRAKNTELPKDIEEFSYIVKQQIYKQRLQDYEDFSRNRTIGFDNLALEQLDIRSALTDSEWNSIYMGEEGSHSMYIDAVEGKFARTSRSPERVSWDSISLLDYFRSL
jgi:hypothetical protein